MSQIEDYLERVLRRRSHYRRVFVDTGGSGAAVLADLRRFCKAGDSALVVGPGGQSDPMATGVALGRQEVFWRIAHHLHLDDAALLKMKESTNDE